MAMHDQRNAALSTEEVVSDMRTSRNGVMVKQEQLDVLMTLAESASNVLCCGHNRRQNPRRLALDKQDKHPVGWLSLMFYEPDGEGNSGRLASHLVTLFDSQLRQPPPRR